LSLFRKSRYLFVRYIQIKIIIERIKPKLSIIFTARNDNYGGNLVERIQAAIKVLIYLTNKYRFYTELIIVEYNPPGDKLRLHTILKLDNNKYLTIRFIEVPHAYHKTLPSSDRTPFFEFIAKNIGIRRATADFILSTNLDIIFSDQLFAFFSSHTLDAHAFYRINRTDIDNKEFPPQMTSEKILTLSKQSAYVTLTERGPVILRPFSFMGIKALILKYLYPLFVFLKFQNIKNSVSPVHEQAAGDFLLMHKKIWNKIRGFSEEPISGYLDGYILCYAYSMGYSQIILPFPIYHILHDYAREGRPTKTLAEYITNRNRILKTKKPVIQNHLHWGAYNHKFQEKVFSKTT